GWIMVKSKELASSALIEAMERGDFYASTGVTLKNSSFKNNKLEIEVAAAPGVDYKIEFIGCKKGEKEAVILHAVDANEAVFNLRADLLFVRAKVTSTKRPENPVENIDAEMAWTQPVTYQE